MIIIYFGLKKLYGIKVNEWYDHAKDKDSNVETFLELVENKPEKSLCHCNG